MTLSDEDLLRQYANDRSNAAFAELVGRYLSLVYSAARRQVQSSALAEEITQSVFIDLSKNAGKLKPSQPLAAWLYLVTRRTAIDVIRQESRRRSREQTASEIAAMTSHPAPWALVEPLLDEAMEALSETDRQALLLRYFASKSLREVGEFLGTSEDAAQKRISRALEQLRTVFVRRGIAVTAAGLAADLSAHAIVSVPAGLCASVSTAALTTTVLAQTTHTIAMTTLNKTLIAASLVLAASLVYETNLLGTGQSQLGELKKDISERQRQTRQLTEERDNAAALLVKKREQLAAEQNRAREADATDSALEAWLGRVTLLKERLAQMPEKNIAEMRFLTSSDWLTVTLDNKLQTEAKIRSALTELRRMAKAKPEISENLPSAMKAYSKYHDGRTATDVAQLRPYLNPLLADDILQRYELVPATASAWPGIPARNVGKNILQERAAVDEDRDILIELYEDGTMFRIVNNNLGKAEVDAEEAFKQAHHGQEPVNAMQVFPYIKMPIDETKFKEFWEAYHRQ